MALFYFFKKLFETPPTINADAMADLVASTAEKLYGVSAVEKPLQAIMATEDFSFYLQKIPGCYFGMGNGSGHDHYVHHPEYVFDDNIIPIAAKLLAIVAIEAGQGPQITSPQLESEITAVY